MTRWEPDYHQAYTTEETIPEGCEAFHLTAGGFLLAVCIQAIGKNYPQAKIPESPSAPSRYRAKFKLTDAAPRKIEFINWYWELPSCGIAFDSPMPNMNSSRPYILTPIWPEKMPALKLYITHLHVEG